MIDELLRKYPLVSDQVDTAELRVILLQLQHVLDTKVPGHIVELGCYTGTTSLFIQRLLHGQAGREFHVYDSFAGLPPKTPEDNSPAGSQFQAGELTASKQAFIRHFRQAGLALPHIHKAWFHDLAPSDLPHPIAFAFLDGDFYESISHSLRLIQDRLSPGACIVVDDYQSEALPGAAKATNAWLQDKPYRLKVQASLAVIHC